MTNSPSYLVWLDWPERCFCAGARQIAYLKSLVPDGSEVRRVRCEKEFLRRLPQATHAIAWNFRKEWFASAPRLRVLATPGAGRELVAHGDCVPEGVEVHFGGFHGKIISESVVGFVLAWARGFFRPELKTDPRLPWRDTWPRRAVSDRCPLLSGSKAVIAGYGKIGRAIGAKLEALGVSVSGVSRKNAADVFRLAKNADWFIMALPGDTGTDHFLDARLLRALPRRAVVVNVGRGNAVDEAALLAALRSGRIAGAYLDVFSGEPGSLPYGRDTKGGILSVPLRELPANLVMTPHSSAFSDRYVEMCFEELADEGLL